MPLTPRDCPRGFRLQTNGDAPMLRGLLSLALTAGMTMLATAQKTEPPTKDKEEPKGELLKTIIEATAEFDKDKKKLTITALGQVPTGGWTDAKLTRKKTKE